MKPLPPPWDRFVPFAQRVFVWAMVFGIIWLLRHFFILVFLTFVFGYVLQHFVQRTARLIPSRRLRVVVVFLAILLVLVGLGWTIGPALAQQAKDFPRQLDENLDKVDQLIADAREKSPTWSKMIPEDLRARDIVAEILPGKTTARTTGTIVPLAPARGEVPSPEALSAAVAGLARATEGLAAAVEGGEESAAGLVTAQEGLAAAARELESAAQDSRGAVEAEARADDERWKEVLPLVISIAERSVAIGSAFLLSLLFSFLIVLDLSNLARGARHLHDTKLQFIYDEVSDNVFYFGRVLGQALEAQLMIAIVNTIFTLIGLYFMGLPNLAFLSMVVFVCSFIPVVGVFLSSIPICLAALTAGGLSLMLISVGFIAFIHLIEAYILNPRLYAAHMRMNPVLVLAILVISHHLFGIWGLILGVPVVSFAVKHVIHIKAGRHDAPAQA